MPIYTIYSEAGELLRRVECPESMAADQVRPGERIEEGDTGDHLTGAFIPVEMEVRARRQGLLYASDWAVLPDSPAGDRDAWVAYRQALRDITSQPGFPIHVEWPVAPNRTPQVDAGS